MSQNASESYYGPIRVSLPEYGRPAHAPARRRRNAVAGLFNEDDYLLGLNGMHLGSLWNWSGMGQKYDVDYESLGSDLEDQLMTGTAIGHGAAGTVQRVVCCGIPLAQKSIRTTTSAAVAAVKSEVETILNLKGHRHIVQLVGTYYTTDHGHKMYHLLTFPVADCDMDIFLNDCDSLFRNECSHSTWQRILRVSKIDATDYALSYFLQKSLGCITNAIQWMHDAKYSHDDIKPSNILLRAGKIYITDFGISQDRRHAEDTSTGTYPGSSYGWRAPEKIKKHNPYLSDVHSLGCFFLHVITVPTDQPK